jgi:hypothetical protein
MEQEKVDTIGVPYNGQSTVLRSYIKPQHRKPHDPDVTFEEYHYYAQDPRGGTDFRVAERQLARNHAPEEDQPSLKWEESYQDFRCGANRLLRRSLMKSGRMRVVHSGRRRGVHVSEQGDMKLALGIEANISQASTSSLLISWDRIEWACHATLKAYLQRGHGDLSGVFERLKLFWTAQQPSIPSTVAQQQLRPKHGVNIPLFAAVLQHIHTYALQKILQEQRKLPARDGPPPSSCTCLIKQSMGLPCYHTIYQRQQESGVIRLEDIHPHWYVIKPESGTYSRPTMSHPLPVLNPLPLQGRGRSRGPLGRVVRRTSTRRDPSSFEIPSSSAPPALNRPRSLCILSIQG